MKKLFTFIAILFLLTGTANAWFFSDIFKEQSFSVAPRIFRSSQVGTSATTDYVLQTDGSASTWVNASTLSTNQNWELNSSGNLTSSTSPLTIEISDLQATSTTATSTFPQLWASQFQAGSYIETPYIYATSTTLASIIDYRLGIGISSPATLLHLQAGSNVFRISDSTDTDRLNFTANTILSGFTGDNIRLGAGNELSLQTYSGGWQTRIQIQNDGLIGIGTTSPYAKLSVVGETVAEYFTATSTTASLFTGGASFGDNNITNIGQIDIDLIRADAANGSITIELDNAAGADLIIGNNNALVVEGDDDQVGIRTATPSEALDIGYGHLNLQNTLSPAAPTIAINATAGNLNGAYKYEVTYVTSEGESSSKFLESNSVSPVNQQIDISGIATGGAEVTARKLYRTLGGAGYPRIKYLVTTINDNVTTTYTDNLVDGSLGAAIPFTNTTGGIIKLNGNRVFELTPSITAVGDSAGANAAGVFNVFIGAQSGFNVTTGYSNNYIGYQTGFQTTTGNNNTAFGAQALNKNTVGFYLVAIGTNAGYFTTGDRVTSVGAYAGYKASSGVRNTNLGYAAGYNHTTPTGNTNLGAYTGFNNITGGGNVHLGIYAGYNNTTSNKLYIDNSTTATPLIYGDFGTDDLTFNAATLVQGIATTDIVLTAKGVASQSGSLFNLVDSSDNIYITSGDGLTGSEFRGNDQNVDIDFIWEGNTDDSLFYLDAGNDRIGIGTGTPAALLDVFSTATTTTIFDSNSASKGWCGKYKDVDAGGYTYCYTLNGAMTCSQTSCE